MAQHTPGPWESHYQFSPERKVLQVQARQYPPVARVYAHSGQAVAEANANLMAAAPDLLAALEGLRSMSSVDLDAEPKVQRLQHKRLQDAADAAIAKAKGGA